MDRVKKEAISQGWGAIKEDVGGQALLILVGESLPEGYLEVELLSLSCTPSEVVVLCYDGWLIGDREVRIYHCLPPSLVIGSQLYFNVHRENLGRRVSRDP